MTQLIKINGRTTTVPFLSRKDKNLTNLIKALGYKLGQISVKVNGTHVRMKDFDSYILQEYDQIDIVTLIAGG